jgi:DNA-binding GntR family transcriptional regulator
MTIRPNFGDVPRRLSDQVAGFLREEIYSGHLAPGERLLEVEICERLGISRAPLREALLTLHADGLLDMRPHRGATVTAFSDDDIREIFALRLHLDPLAASAAAQRCDPDAIASLRAALTQMDLAVQHRDGLAEALAHADFHRALGRASGMTRLASFIDSLCTQMLASHGTGMIDNPDQASTLVPDHAAIVEAIAAGDADEAAEKTRVHFRPVDPMLDSYRRLRDAS